jgi:hypothetical protein
MGFAVGLRIAASRFRSAGHCNQPPAGRDWRHRPRGRPGLHSSAGSLVPGGISSTAKPPRRYIRIFGRANRFERRKIQAKLDLAGDALFQHLDRQCIELD